MTVSLVTLVAGMALLLIGGRFLVAGASALARGLGVSELTVALTVVAFGTSAPELAVNVTAAVEGDTAIAFGNVIGSNFTNLALVLGACALIRPLDVEGNILNREIPLMLLATAVGVALGIDLQPPSADVYARNDGFVFLLLFAVFLTRTVASVLSEQSSGPLESATATLGAPAGSTSALAGGLRVGGGLLGLIVGGHLAVDGAVGLAEAARVPETVIALTVVALGTSLPELVTSLVAAARGQTDLAIGNVVGSNVFNLLFILGATAAIRPVEVPAVGGLADLAVMAGVSLAVFVFALMPGHKIQRWHGALLLTTYVVYVVMRFTT